MRLCIRFKQLFFTVCFTFISVFKFKQSIETIPSTLLVSATPNYYFVKDFLDISEDGIEGIQSFNDKKYQIEFVDYDESLEDKSNPLYKKVDKNTFVISNTATTAQKSFTSSEISKKSLTK
jgi:CRISPR-associated endonuclease/helicase Cas3